MSRHRAAPRSWREFGAYSRGSRLSCDHMLVQVWLYDWMQLWFWPRFHRCWSRLNNKHNNNNDDNDNTNNTIRIIILIIYGERSIPQVERVCICDARLGGTATSCSRDQCWDPKSLLFDWRLIWCTRGEILRHRGNPTGDSTRANMCICVYMYTYIYIYIYIYIHIHILIWYV